MQYQASLAATESWANTNITMYYCHYLPHRHSSIMHQTDPLERLAKLVSESAVVIFSLSSCCMCLFSGMGVNPAIYELDQIDPTRVREIERALIRLVGNSMTVPVVFVDGKLVGSMDKVVASDINGTLVPLLKKAGVLWF